MPKDKEPMTETTVEQKLDAILEHLRRIDNRDRLRTVGGFFRSLIALIPIIILVWSSWYFAMHYDEIMKKIIDMSASAAVQSTRGSSSDQQMQDILNQMKAKYGLPK